jgi:hypothetical protein
VKKGIEKSLWVRRFIKGIDYSRDEIALFLYYKGSEGTGYGIPASDRAKENAGRNLVMIDSKENLGISDWSSSCYTWLRDLDFSQTIPIILPNTIHSCKKKNL